MILLLQLFLKTEMNSNPSQDYKMVLHNSYFLITVVALWNKIKIHSKYVENCNLVYTVFVLWKINRVKHHH